MLTNWPKLVSLSMTMPWILDDGTRHATFVPAAQLRSLELSGFRGDLAELSWLLAACRSTLTRFHFDCPLDQEPWCVTAMPGPADDAGTSLARR